MTKGQSFRPAIAFLFAALIPLLFILPANALSMKECSAKYKAAQSAGEADGVSWSDYRKAQCTTPVSAVVTDPDDSKSADKKTQPETKAVSGKTTFPSSISSKFASEKPAKARMHTCLEQYRANKDAGTLGYLGWIKKGSSYYSLCNAKLKGAGL